MKQQRDRVRIGFVGAGSMGQCAHLRNYATLEGCEVVALAEIRADVREAVARRYGVPRTYASHRDMLADDDLALDGIVASQPFTRHGLLVPELLEAGVPLFTEKPLAGSVQVGQGIVAAVEASGTWHMVGYHKRSDPATMVARAEIERLQRSGELGAMTYVRITMPPGDWIAAGFSDLIRGAGRQDSPPLEHDPSPPDMDADTYAAYIEFVNYYIHQVNLLRHLLGEPYELAHADPARVLLVARSASGRPGLIEMAPYETSIGWQETALICFERGTIHLELPAPLASNRPGRVAFFRDPGDGATPQTVEPQLPWVHAMRQQAQNFLAAIRGEAEPPCQAAEALQDLRLARDYIRAVTGT